MVIPRMNVRIATGSPPPPPAALLCRVYVIHCAVLSRGGGVASTRTAPVDVATGIATKKQQLVLYYNKGLLKSYKTILTLHSAV
jgi:hypothetical protein